jgi:hypothetical protein
MGSSGHHSRGSEFIAAPLAGMSFEGGLLVAVQSVACIASTDSEKLFFIQGVDELQDRASETIELVGRISDPVADHREVLPRKEVLEHGSVAEASENVWCIRVIGRRFSRHANETLSARPMSS